MYIHCSLCEPNFNKRFERDAGPLRKVVKEGITQARFDPTVYYKLSCGHTVI